jgi:hypothetical protein
MTAVSLKSCEKEYWNLAGMNRLSTDYFSDVGRA